MTGETSTAKTKAGKRTTKSDFLRKAVDRNLSLDLKQLNRQWLTRS